MVNDLGERQEGYFCKFTFGQFVTFATLEIAMLFFVFYLGARFGPEIAGLAGASSHEARVEAEVETPRDVAAVSPREVLTYTEPQAQPVDSTLRTLRAPSTEAETAILKSAQSVVRVKQSDRSRYTVQVGSYPTVKEGTDMVEQWKGRGYEAYMTLGEIPGRGIWYRVRIGNFSSRAEAEKMAGSINAKERSAVIVVAQET